MKVLEQGVLCHSEDKDAGSCGHFQYANVSRCHAKKLTIELTAVNIVNKSTPVRSKPYTLCKQCLDIVSHAMSLSIVFAVIIITTQGHF